MLRLRDMNGCVEADVPFRKCPFLAAGVCADAVYGSKRAEEPPCSCMSEDTDMDALYELCKSLEEQY